MLMVLRATRTVPAPCSMIATGEYSAGTTCIVVGGEVYFGVIIDPEDQRAGGNPPVSGKFLHFRIGCLV